MALIIRTVPQSLLPALDLVPLSVNQLEAYAGEILEFIQQYRHEFYGLAMLQYNCGCRINELFQRNRWTVVNQSTLQIQPQKGNNVRVLPCSDLGFANANAMAAIFADMERLPKGQYERCFSRAVEHVGLWRLYEYGYARPSSHLFRHLKVKKMAAENFSVEQIGQYIGEKNLDNLNYYLNSQYFSELR